MLGLVLVSNFHLQDLLKDASSQYHIQRQAKTVLTVCSGGLSMDDVEAERIILLAGALLLCRTRHHHDDGRCNDGVFCYA